MMRFLLACAVFGSVLVSPAIADETLPVQQAAVEEPDDAAMLTPVPQAELDQVRGTLFGGPVPYSIILASAFAAAQQFRAAYMGGCRTGYIQREGDGTYSFLGCAGGD